MSDIRVVIADDQALVRGSFRVLIDTTPGFACVGEASTGAQAVEVARRERPDVLLMDVRMPEMDGVEATRVICQGADALETKVIMLTTFDLDEYVIGGFRAGASGFLLKEVMPDDLIGGIRAVVAGDRLMAPGPMGRLIDAYIALPERPLTPLPQITGREREVLVLVARGLSNDQISSTLGVSMSTVKTHINRLLTKIDGRDRSHLVIAAYEAGL
ncbi:response regulator transcription factor [Actinoplanes sp. LDG1-06]|uniref:Response regulator transcription factor n=1 Tax=Paractinoplanes ovalisporus TaxID=2810368 RepID=A0ABS2AEF3_9ACTN|nr:response regulator transcription factor [Actinoplanes ovalisporus]MBM2617768.1 response regulator transcription factor [Actinoplanes ovalisporus]